MNVFCACPECLPAAWTAEAQNGDYAEPLPCRKVPAEKTENLSRHRPADPFAVFGS